MFSVASFLDVSESRAGMLIPVLSAPNTNLPYVQQMDEFLQVKEIVPFLEYENYLLIANDHRRMVNVGDKGLIAFRSTDDAIVCGDIEEILKYISDNRKLILESPNLHSQLLRIESAEIETAYAAWRRVGDAVFEDVDQRRFWVDSEHQLFQKQRKIWAEIDPQEAQDPKTADSGIYGSISEYGSEYLIRWLTNRSNFDSKSWTKVWHYVNAKSPFDERVAQTALSWVFYIGHTDVDVSQTKSVLYAVLERWLFNADAQLPDLADFLTDRLTDDLSLIFEFLRPRRLLSLLLLFLAHESGIDDVVRILNFCDRELPNEELVNQPLYEALQIIVSDTTERMEKGRIVGLPARDFQESYAALARTLLDRMEENS